jgi:hypothetical protein
MAMQFLPIQANASASSVTAFTVVALCQLSGAFIKGNNEVLHMKCFACLRRRWLYMYTVARSGATVPTIDLEYWCSLFFSSILSPLPLDVGLSVLFASHVLSLLGCVLNLEFFYCCASIWSVSMPSCLLTPRRRIMMHVMPLLLNVPRHARRP